MVDMDGSSFGGSSAQHNPTKRKTDRHPKNNNLLFILFLLFLKGDFWGPGQKKPRTELNRSGDVPFLSSRSNTAPSVHEGYAKPLQKFSFFKGLNAFCSDRSSDFPALSAAFPFMSLLLNGLFEQFLRYAQKIILGIL
jgi:hypothetical protein